MGFRFYCAVMCWGHYVVVKGCATFAAAVVANRGCSIADKCFLGSGDVLHQYISIGRETSIGMGIIVLGNVREKKSVVSLPR